MDDSGSNGRQENDEQKEQIKNDENNVIEMHSIERNDDVNKPGTGFGKIGRDSTLAAVNVDKRTLIGIGWVSAALTAFVSPYFVFLGVLVGVLANRQEKGSGNNVIITNIVVAALNILFGFFLILSMRRMLFGL